MMNPPLKFQISDIAGSFTSPGGISGTTFDSADNDNSDGNTEDDPTIVMMSIISWRLPKPLLPI